jgi:hypothetical protein
MNASTFSLSLVVERDEKRCFVVTAPFLSEPVRGSTFEETYTLALRAYHQSRGTV